MKKSFYKVLFFVALFLSSLSSIIFLNNAENRASAKILLPQTTAKTESEKESRNLVLPDVTVLQKIFDLFSKIVTR
jgi:hypothetical protein